MQGFRDGGERTACINLLHHGIAMLADIVQLALFSYSSSRSMGALVIYQAQEIARLQTTIVPSSATPPPPPVQGAAAVHISPHMRNTGLIPHIPGLMELAAASRKRKRDCLEFISKMSEDYLKDITTAVKERMGAVEQPKKAKK